ncbi:MAG: hypothetical protein FWD92_02990 [Methanomassiliicoccaceae archaeon]|nr:hypothetical protein [Methanomassiliicoccaceae archaeon]
MRSARIALRSVTTEILKDADIMRTDDNVIISGIPKIYLETSALNFYFADDSPDKRDDTVKLFQKIKEGKYLPFTSRFTIDEIEKATAEKRNMLNNLIDKHKIDTSKIPKK